jgi:hypothetical protein
MGVDLAVKRREILGILTIGAAAAAAVEGQTPPNADAELQAARQGLQGDAQRVAMVKLPPATEPAVHFHA